MSEVALADLIPHWRTVHEGGVTAAITPALDYVGALELGSLDVRYAGGEAIGNLGEALRSVVGGLDDETTLHFMYRVDGDVAADIRDYQKECAPAAARSAALAAYIEDRAHWLSRQSFRRTRVFLFYSGVGGGAGLNRGQLGVRLVFANAEKLGAEKHAAALKALAKLRDRLLNRFQQAGIPVRELAVGEVQRLYFDLLNPGRARANAQAPAIHVRQDLWNETAFRTVGDHLREYTEAEQLVFEDVELHRGHLRHGPVVRRVMTLKVLPEGGTNYFASEALAALTVAGAGGDRVPFPYWLTATVTIRPQGRAKFFLNNQHKLVKALRSALPFLQSESVAQDAADRAQRASIEGLFEELANMSSKIAALSVSVLLEADTLERVEEQTEATRAAFAGAGNSEALVEDVTQLQAFLSMLPGAGRYQLRQKGCTSRNAGDFLPVYAPWRGSTRAASLFGTPSGDLFRLDLFDKTLSTSSHGIVFADTGSGKSFSLGVLSLDALASGSEAVLVDNGASWKEFTELLGGTYIPVDLRTSISPFVSYEELVGEDGEPSNEELESVLRFLEVCVTDRSLPGFDKVQSDTITRAIKWCYTTRFRERARERPLVGAFKDALEQYPWTSPDDRAIAERVARSLRIFCDGVYGDFLNRPSTLRYDAPLLTFDVQAVTQSPMAKSIAMAAIMQAINNRAMARKTRTLVEIDEGHEHLGQDDVGERFLQSAYRRYRKYGVSCWLISQKLRDFTSAKAGPAIVGNSAIKIFLRHGQGHEEVASYFGMSDRSLEAFRKLAMKPGYYSDFMLLYAGRTTVLRLAPHPLAYWLLTTDPEDRKLLDKAASKNPGLSRLELLQGMAQRYPHGLIGSQKR